MLRQLPLFLLIVLLVVTSRFASAQQQTRHGAVVPSIGGGGLDRVGPQIYLGLQVQRGFGATIVGTVQAAAWTAVGTCSDASIEDGLGCSKHGTNADIGINAQANAAGSVRPYVGVGAGAMSVHGWAPALNTRAGLAVGPRRGAQLHLEVRIQRVFGDVDAVGGILSAGIGIGW